MANTLEVSDSQMKSDIDAMRTEIEKLNTDAEGLEELLGELSQHYSGPAYETFRNTILEGLEALRELINFWQQYIEAFQGAEKVYIDAERAVYNDVHRVRI